MFLYYLQITCLSIKLVTKNYLNPLEKHTHNIMYTLWAVIILGHYCEYRWPMSVKKGVFFLASGYSAIC